jgi:hypothetical protein
MTLNIFNLYPRWTCILWFAILAQVGVVEVLGLLRWHGAIPLTWVVRDSVPRWLLWSLLGWAAYHFGVVTNVGQATK